MFNVRDYFSFPRKEVLFMSDETRNTENNEAYEINDIFDNSPTSQNIPTEETIYSSHPQEQTAQPKTSEDVVGPYHDTPVTEDRNEPIFSSTQTEYESGIAYTKNVDGNVTNCYEWNNSDTNDTKKKESESSKKSSGKGFRVFLTIVLSVFTVSIVTMTAMVASHIYNNGIDISSENNDSHNKESSQDIQTSEEFDYSSVTLDNPNYVAFDFKEHDSGNVLSIPEIAAKCSPSSVGIISEVEVSYNYPFYFGGSSTRVAEASGSGFVYSADGYIITNHHVIENATKVTVILHDGSEYDAEIIGSDSLSDIAVLKITPDEETQLIPMEVGDSDALVVGEPVVAIGCPAGIEFIGTVTDGIVSSINRNVEITDDYGSIQKTMTLIQTNATINHGNSGGPLINAKGQVIGINTLKLAQDYEGIGFSIPMNGAVPIISQLIEHGEVVERTEEDFAYGKGIIGINGSAITEDEAEYYGIPVGVLVVQIDRESSAAAAGLRRGDIITHYNGKEVTSVDDINNAKNNARPGTEVTLTVYRDGERNKGESVDITFKLDAQE